MIFAMLRRSFIVVLIIALGLLLGGCATSVFNTSTNLPMTSDTPPGMGAPADIGGENAILLSFSGGGLRAAAFAHGVLKALAEIKTPTGDLLDDLTYVSSVSGGSLTAAYYGLYGREGLATFRENVLLRDYESNMYLSVFQPMNMLRLLGGGLNNRQNFGDTLNRDVFRGATFADIYRHPKPDIRIHATDLYNGIAFPFIPRVFSGLCSDIRSYSVADAVAASMALPLVFAPVVLRTYPDHCFEPLPPMLGLVREEPDSSRQLKAVESAMASYRDSNRVRYIKLVDGGISDNFGLSTMIISRAILDAPYAPMTKRDAVRIRRLLFIVVDASRRPHGEWASRMEGPGGVDLALRAIDAATDISARYSADSFSRMVSDWQDSVIQFRCRLAPSEVALLRGSAAQWDCADVKFSLTFLTIDHLEPEFRRQIEAIDTRLTLPSAQIDATIEGARQGTLALQRLREYVQDRRN
jgi:NTE family protein